MKVGDLVRYDPGPNWTKQEKVDNCAVGLVLNVPTHDKSVQVKWTSHGRSDISWETQSAMEVLSEGR